MTPKFVEFIPENIKENILYVSIEYSTAVHKCCCGCGNEVVTPFSPTDWNLTYDGESITITPSIGNWNFKCKSHYYIRNNEIHWAGIWSEKEIKKGRLLDKTSKSIYYVDKNKQSKRKSKVVVKKKRWSFWNWLIGKKLK